MNKGFGRQNENEPANGRLRPTSLLTRSLGAMATAGLLFGSLVSPAHSCALALVVAMDGSSSVDAREHDLQLQGLARALQDPDVVEAIQNVGGIWFSSFEWSGRYQQSVQVDWSFLESDESVDLAAQKIFASGRGFTEFPTALGYALGFAAVHLRAVPQRCARHVIDVAGDGINNEGFAPASAYRAFGFEAITVNGLVIAGETPDPVAYYRDEVIRGPGAFIEVADGFEDYAAAMKRKLLREIGTDHYARLRTEQ